MDFDLSSLKQVEKSIIRKKKTWKDQQKENNKYLGIKESMKDLIEEGLNWNSEILMAKGYCAIAAVFGTPVQKWPRTAFNYYESASKIRGNPEIYDDKIKSYRIYQVFKNLYLTLATRD